MNNKYQDALNSLNPNYIGEQEYSWRKATEILQELVDKETPMKVNEYTTMQDPFEPKEVWQFPICPNCKDEVCESNKYCHNCGQKLDWSDKNDR